MKHYNELLGAVENVRIGIHHSVSQLGCFNPQCFFQTEPDFLNKLWFADCASLLRLCCNDRQHYSGAQGLDSWVYLIKPSPSLFFFSAQWNVSTKAVPIKERKSQLYSSSGTASASQSDWLESRAAVELSSTFSRVHKQDCLLYKSW